MTAPPAVRWTEKAGREVARKRSGGLCEIGLPGCMLRANSVHHRKNRSQGGGGWAPSGLLAACGSGTTGCHGLVTAHPALARERGLSVPSWGDVARTPIYALIQPWYLGWWLLGEDGLYDSAWALDCALALGLPEVPSLPDRSRRSA